MRPILFSAVCEREAVLQRAIDLLLVVIKALLAEHGPAPLRLDDDARRDIAIHAHTVGWKAAAILLKGVCVLTIVQGWYCRLVTKVAKVPRKRKHRGGN